MMRSCSLAALFAALAQPGHSKLTRPRTSKRLEAAGGESALALVEQRTDSFFLQSRRGCRGQLATLSTTLAITLPRLGRVCAPGPALDLCSYINRAAVRIEQPQPVSVNLTETSKLVTSEPSFCNRDCLTSVMVSICYAKHLCCQQRERSDRSSAAALVRQNHLTH
jgi:hypothetical protein